MSILTSSLLINDPIQGNLVRQHNQRFEHLPDDIRVSTAGEDAGFMRKVSREQCFVTIHDIWLAGLGRVGECREYTALQDEERSQSKGWIRGNTEVGPELEVKVTHHSYHIGIEIEIDTMKND